MFLGELGVAKDMLIPLARAHGQQDLKLLTEITKLVVQMTMPIDDTLHKNKQARLTHLRAMKAAFLEKGALQCFTNLIEGILESGGVCSTDQDKLVVELVLWLIRNLLAIPDVAGKGEGNSASAGSHRTKLHDDFLAMISEEYIAEVLLFLGECVGKEGE